MKRIKLHHRETGKPIELSLSQLDSIVPDSNGSIKTKTGNKSHGIGYDREPKKWARVYLKGGTSFETLESYLEIKALCLS